MNRIVKGNVVRYKLENIYALNFILYDSLGGGGSDSLLNDAQGKTHAQTLLMMEIDLPDKLRSVIDVVVPSGVPPVDVFVTTIAKYE